MRGGLAVLIAVAVLVQFRSGSLRPGFSAVNFFSFFTIQSNIALAGVFLAGALGGRSVGGAGRDAARGAVTVYIATTGLVYAVLLSGLEEALAMTLPWVNVVLHVLTPIAGLLDWWLEPPRARLGAGRVAQWLAYPLAYAVYSLARGARTGWYPYPFLDPGPAGDHARVAATCLGIAVVVGLLGLAIRAIGNRRR